MKKLKINFIYILSLFVIIFATGCNDNIPAEITELNTDRLFSPTDLEARVVNQTSVRLNWKKIKGAETYAIQVFEGEENYEGTPVRNIQGVYFENLPYDISGFEGETIYSVRVQAVGTESESSKWIGTTFKTDAEQIFYAVDATEIEATQVILRWQAGEVATHIALTPGDLIHTLTPDEIAAGVATITELTPETEYTAKLMNGEKTRGTVSFKTLLDLGGAILVEPEDNLVTIVQNASPGDVFALMPGEYVIDNDIAISTTVGIKGARPAEKPVIKGAVFRMKQGSGIELVNLILDGTGAKDGNQTIVYDDDSETDYADTKIENCEISNYVKGIFYVNKKALINSVTFTGNYIHDIECAGGDFIDFRAGIARTFTFKNNTVSNSALARDFFRMDAGGATNFPDVVSKIAITNNTFDKVIDGDNRRMLYIRLGSSGEITFTHNVLSNTLGRYTNQSTTNIVKMEKNNYHNAPNFVGLGDDTSGDYYTLDPGYPATGDFTITNEDLIFYGIGNLSWQK
jgi:hypothetical protein